MSTGRRCRRPAGPCRCSRCSESARRRRAGRRHGHRGLRPASRARRRRAFLAFIPLAVVLLGIRWVDRWEPEPHATLVAAFLWGAGVATAISLIFNTAIALGRS